MGANIFHRPQTFSAGREHFSQAANISFQVPRVGANIFRRPQTFPLWRKIFKVRLFQKQSVQGAKQKSKKQK
jgi:hypothetical protein